MFTDDEKKQIWSEVAKYMEEYSNAKLKAAYFTVKVMGVGFLVFMAYVAILTWAGLIKW